jgi:hypothetical protein
LSWRSRSRTASLPSHHVASALTSAIPSPARLRPPPPLSLLIEASRLFYFRLSSSQSWPCSTVTTACRCRRRHCKNVLSTFLRHLKGTSSHMLNHLCSSLFCPHANHRHSALQTPPISVICYISSYLPTSFIPAQTPNPHHAAEQGDLSRSAQGALC